MAYQKVQQIGQVFEGAIQQVQKIFRGPLDGIESVKFDQSGPDYLEGMCQAYGCCEKENQYYISPGDRTISFENITTQIGTINENKSSFLCLCLCKQWRSWEQSMSDSQGNTIWRSTRPYRIPAVFGCPIFRPEVTVYSNEVIIGTLVEPYGLYTRNGPCSGGCCSCYRLSEIDVIDTKGIKKYEISATSCQCGMMLRGCPRCCGPCSITTFGIFDPYSKMQIGNIRNIYGKALTELCSKSDRFILDFPPNATHEDKCLLMNAVLMIDYDIYESIGC